MASPGSQQFPNFFQVVAHSLLGPWLFAHSGPPASGTPPVVASAVLSRSRFPLHPRVPCPPTSETHGAGQMAAFNSDSSASWLRGRGQLALPLCALVFPLCRMGAVTVRDICENSNSFMNIGCKDGKKPRSHLRAGVGSKQDGGKKKRVCSRKTRDECWQN